MSRTAVSNSVAIACGGTGGHLFPGVAVGQELCRHGCSVTLLISSKDIDQKAVAGLAGTQMRVVALPAVALTHAATISFARGFVRSYMAARKLFRSQPPKLLLAMGGFTSAPPLLAARRLGARTFLHESNTIPGRANRWLSRIVDRAFVAFPSASKRLRCRDVVITGTPVRSAFLSPPPVDSRALLGLESAAPVGLVMGGSQGASGINAALVAAMPSLRQAMPGWQWLHLTGAADAVKVAQAYQAHGLNAVVHAFLDKMELALGVAALAITRAGGSSLAELAARRVPAVLIPYPAATDNHQWHNAHAFEQMGCGRLLEQQSASPEVLVPLLLELACEPTRERMRRALAQWHRPDCAERIAASMLECSLGSTHESAAAATPLGSPLNRNSSVLA